MVSRHLHLLVLLWCIISSSLLLLTVATPPDAIPVVQASQQHLEEKSYRISSIHSSLHIDPDRCTTTVTELITFEFTGQYRSIGRYFPRTIDGTLPFFSNYQVYSSSVYTSSYYLLNDDSGSGRYLVWDFVMNAPPPGQVSVITFELTFSIDGIFKIRGASSRDITLFYSYKWNAPVVGPITANVSLPSPKPDGVSWTPKGDGWHEVTRDGTAQVSFTRDSSLLTNEPYYITVSLPVKMGTNNWSSCKVKTSSNKRPLIIVGSIFGGIGVMSLVICIWSRTGSSSSSSTGYDDNNYHLYSNNNNNDYQSSSSSNDIGGGSTSDHNISSASGSSGFAV